MELQKGEATTQREKHGEKAKTRECGCCSCVRPGVQSLTPEREGREHKQQKEPNSLEH